MQIRGPQFIHASIYDYYVHILRELLLLDERKMVWKKGWPFVGEKEKEREERKNEWSPARRQDKEEGGEEGKE